MTTWLRIACDTLDLEDVEPHQLAAVPSHSEDDSMMVKNEDNPSTNRILVPRQGSMRHIIGHDSMRKRWRAIDILRHRRLQPTLVRHGQFAQAIAYLDQEIIECLKGEPTRNDTTSS